MIHSFILLKKKYFHHKFISGFQAGRQLRRVVHHQQRPLQDPEPGGGHRLQLRVQAVLPRPDERDRQEGRVGEGHRRTSRSRPTQKHDPGQDGDVGSRGHLGRSQVS